MYGVFMKENAKIAQVIYVSQKKISCNGGESKYRGHPKVYLTVEKNNQIVCPYCMQVYIYDEARKGDTHTY